MIKSTKNQLGNAHNKYQGERLRVLCVCSAGLLRSPTIAVILADEFGWNTRSCGVSTEFALIPISEVLVEWAQYIVFADNEHFDATENYREKLKGKDFNILEIPDEYEYMDDGLVDLIKEKIYKATAYTF